MLRKIALSAVFGVMGFAPVWADQPAVNVYNQMFAVVREKITLELQAGPTEVMFDEITAHVEPDSVILRDPEGKVAIRVLEQNYRADPLSQGLLLSYFEGQTIDFRVQEGMQSAVKPGKIIRSGYVPHQQARNRFGNDYWARQMMAASPGGMGEAIIEMDGQLRFGLSGPRYFRRCPRMAC